LDIVLFKGKKRTCSAKPNLNFIKNEECTGFIAAFSECLEIARGRCTDAPFCLDGFHDYCSRAGIDLAKTMKAVKINMADARQ